MQLSGRLATGLVVGCMGIFLPCTLIGVLAGVGFARGLAQEPEQVRINVSGPSTASVGEGLAITIRVENIADFPQTLDSIDFADEYLQGITIQTSEPFFVETFDFINGVSYFFLMDIPPGDSIIVQFHGVGARAGEFSGNLDVCINTGGICSTFTLATSISG